MYRNSSPIYYWLAYFLGFLSVWKKGVAVMELDLRTNAYHIP
jgi:hypothetical protein